MKTFDYRTASGLADGLEPGAVFLAGGTNLVDLMKLGVAAPDVLVDVTRLPLHDITTLADGTIRIGSGVRNSDLAADRRVRTGFPLVSQALLAGAPGQLRNMATTGGNLLQRTRCRYFLAAGLPCNKHLPGSGCPARTGDHRDLAILGGSAGCIATHPSDLAVALAAVGAVIRVDGPAGAREIPVTDLYRLPGDEPERDTVLEHGELITAVDLPPLSAAARSAYRKARDRASSAFAAGSVAAALRTGDGLVREVRLAFGAVAPKPWRALAAEEALRGGPATRERFLAAADAELAAARPLRDNAYKIPLIRNLTAAVLESLTEDAR
ncbi:FAD-binding molybdopterin dehydrogenase [Actinoplanes sp. SE50]|uniref:FAD binding domain-containing protein n=1 Tax=unclassified Actinoplanes TaxID=2626549 RepID=UPI00023EC78D|nr:MULTISPECIES: xanthine dehydrogenase family protein subunit M [unclassified Actinoplanes]AEV83671.1 xanthine dehydrogenase YagS FAD-binding subunit [Actinoplanes sp. SE50/110]ATO82185.1 FAD-binding molybdopterin dehydrogenase [Actinoplanes sp. SE50]SLL99592.1 FAD-binding molybdopterin dehydrogenase [Actinoplanes sp. SE50/110]